MLVVGGLVVVAGIALILARPDDDAPGPEAHEPARFVGPAAVVVEPVSVDFGELVPGHPVSRTVLVRNVTDREVRLASALPSCGCTSVEWPRGPIPPGAAAQATVTMTAGDSQGERLAKSVAFLVTGASPAVISVQGVVGMYMSCEPRMLDAPGQGDDPGFPGIIRLKALDGEPFRIARVDPGVAGALPQAAAAEQSVCVDWSRWLALGRPGHVEIATDHPKAPTFTVTLRRPVPVPARP